MGQVRTDTGVFNGIGGVVNQQAALTAAGAQTETGAGVQTETAAVADAPAGDGTAGWDTDGNKDIAVACINRNKVRVAENRLVVDAAVVRIAEHRIILDAAVVRIGELETIISNLGISA